MSAGRLLRLVWLLQGNGRMTARELARRLEVSERTVLRDITTLSGSGVPVYAMRGRFGGFQLLDTFERSLLSPTPPSTGRGRTRWVRVRLTPAALQFALATGRPEGWRRRAATEVAADPRGWITGSFRFDSDETAVRELLAFGGDVEVLQPSELRATMADIGRRIAAMHTDP